MRPAQHEKKNGVKAPSVMDDLKQIERKGIALNRLNGQLKHLKGPMSTKKGPDERDLFELDLETTFIGIERIAGLATTGRSPDWPHLDKPLTKEEAGRLLTYIHDLTGALSLIRAAAHAGMRAVGA